MRGDDEIGFVDFCVGDLPYDETVAGWFEALICMFNCFSLQRPSGQICRVSHKRSDIAGFLHKVWNPLIHGRQSIHTERSVNAFRKVRFQENLKRTSHMRSADMVPQLQVVFASRKIFRFVRWATQRVSVVFDIGAFVQHDRMRSYANAELTHMNSLLHRYAAHCLQRDEDSSKVRTSVTSGGTII